MDKRYPINEKFSLNVELKEYFDDYASKVYGADNDGFTSFDALIGLDSEAYLKQYDPSVLDILRTPISHSIIKYQDYHQINREYRTIKAPKGFVDLQVVKLKHTGAKKLLKYSHELRIELPKTNPRSVSITFLEGKVYMLTIRVLQPFVYLKGKRDRKEVNRFHYEITLLSTNTLLDLKNHFMCTNDLGICKKVGSNLNRSHIPKSKDLYPSSFIYIDSVFYNDLSNPDSIDLSKTIQEWAAKNDCGPFTSASINTRLEKLMPRFGYPYLYYHLGYCEHLFYIADARLIQPYESRNILNYPCYSALGYKRSKFCRTCNQQVCKWIVMSTGGVFPNDVTALCDFCLKSYCFINGEQIHNVDIYPYYDGTALF